MSANEKRPVIEVTGLKKQYKLGQIGGGTLTHDLQSWWARVRGKEDPNTVIGTDQRLFGQTFMALNGVDLTVHKGEALGIIGCNGAGKSTLLKLLCRVTAPTEGEIDIYGRIASMLEVGTGFNGEMTGRENIYMNGAILGMTKAEIDAKNTSQNNIPALSDCPTINDDFELTYAMAVDSEGTSIDLIKHDGAEQAKDFLHLYKNIHFITGEKTVTYSLPFTKVVKKGGDIAPGKQEFELEIFDVGVGQIEDYGDVTITATVATNGEGSYESTLTIQGPKKQVDNITCEGFCVREKNTGFANWTYSDAAYQIFRNDGATDNRGPAQPSFEVFPVELVATDSGEFYEKTQDTPVDVMTFENVYTEKAAPAEDTKPTEGSDPNASNKSDAGDKPAAATPHTGDGNAPIIAIAALLIAAGALFASALRMKKR